MRRLMTPCVPFSATALTADNDDDEVVAAAAAASATLMLQYNAIWKEWENRSLLIVADSSPCYGIISATFGDSGRGLGSVEEPAWFG